MPRSSGRNGSRIHWLAPVLILALPALANALDVQLFHLAPNPSRGGMVFGSDTLPAGTFDAGLGVNWARHPIEFGIPGPDDRFSRVLNNFIALEPQISYGWTDTLSATLQVPIYPFLEIDPIGTIEKSTGGTVGDLQLNALWTLIRRGGERFGKWGFGLVPFVTIPVGSTESFVGNSNLTGGLRLVFDRDLSRKDYLRFNLGFRFRETEQILNLRITDELLMSAGYSRKVSEKHDLDLFAEMFGSTTTGKFFSEEISSPIEIYLGARKSWLDRRLSSVLGIGRGFNNGYGSPDVRVFLGLSWNFEPFRKPAPGHLIVGVELEDGTPYPACLCIEGGSGPESFCREETTACLEQSMAPGLYSVTADPEGFPREKAEVRIESNRTTCAKIVLRRTLEKELNEMGRVLFRLDRSVLDPKSKPVLDGVVDLLRRHPEVTRVRVEGHTDSLAPDDYNQRLSERRARRVVRYLVEAGIEPGRISAAGFGETRPVAPNDTREGRARNRRVQFVVLEAAGEKPAVREYGPGEL